MGARGKHVMRVVNGNETIDISGSAASLVKPFAPTKPDDLSAEVSDLWDEIVPELEKAGMAGPMDGPAIVLALEHYLVARKAAADILENGLKEYDDKNGRWARNASVMVFNSSTEEFIKLTKELGLTFAARTRINATEAESDEKNPFS